MHRDDRRERKTLLRWSCESDLVGESRRRRGAARVQDFTLHAFEATVVLVRELPTCSGGGAPRAQPTISVSSSGSITSVAPKLQ